VNFEQFGMETSNEAIFAATSVSGISTDSCQGTTPRNENVESRTGDIAKTTDVTVSDLVTSGF
jgi:hypothetical protein